MKLVQRIFRFGTHAHNVASAMFFGLIVVGTATGVQAVNLETNPHDPSIGSQIIQKVHKQTSAPPKTTPKPSTSAPATTPAPAPAPTPAAPAPASTPAAAAPAQTGSTAVAQASTSPGTGVSSLTPSGGTSTDTSSSSGTTTSYPATSSGDTYTSSNWSGYMASGASYTKVSGSWVAPTPTGNGRSTTADATWIGIGGVNTDDLIQVGTENTVSASGTVATAAFYELLPDAPVYPASITVTAGDSMTANIVEVSSGRWTISISDLTNGQSFSVTVSYASTHSSVEWVEEDPSFSSGSLVPFDNFGTVSFSGGSTVANGSTQNILGSNAAIITLVGRRGVIAQPSALGGDGASFSVSHL